MPTPLRHPPHVDELIAVAQRQLEGLTSAQARSELTFLIGWLNEASAKVYAERDRQANLPVPTPAGDLIPGSVVNIKARSEYSAPRTIKGAVVSRNHGLTTFDPSTPAEVRLERGGQSLRVKQRDIAEIVVVRPPLAPVHGG
jgi:hypothetical protein